ncbi:hypothetical protein CPB85DRAFT_1279210 [Mucidula mucida]|nr:hypothetical protein CPB85DRAFT_1279210 [Mucidula mucida]
MRLLYFFWTFVKLSRSASMDLMISRRDAILELMDDMSPETVSWSVAGRFERLRLVKAPQLVHWTEICCILDVEMPTKRNGVNHIPYVIANRD